MKGKFSGVAPSRIFKCEREGRVVPHAYRQTQYETLITVRVTNSKTECARLKMQRIPNLALEK